MPAQQKHRHRRQAQLSTTLVALQGEGVMPWKSEWKRWLRGLRGRVELAVAAVGSQITRFDPQCCRALQKEVLLCETCRETNECSCSCFRCLANIREDPRARTHHRLTQLLEHTQQFRRPLRFHPHSRFSTGNARQAHSPRIGYGYRSSTDVDSTAHRPLPPFGP